MFFIWLMISWVYCHFKVRLKICNVSQVCIDLIIGVVPLFDNKVQDILVCIDYDTHEGLSTSGFSSNGSPFKAKVTPDEDDVSFSNSSVAISVLDMMIPEKINQNST